MQSSVLSFVDQLRAGGMKVSPTEIVDALESIHHTGLERKTVFKDALRSTLVKRARDIPLFDSLFDLHFFELAIPGAELSYEEESQTPDLRAALAEALDGTEQQLSPVTGMIMGGQMGQLMRTLLDRSRGLGLQELSVPPLRGTFFVSRLRREMELDRVRGDIEAVIMDMHDRGVDPSIAQATEAFLLQNLERLEEQTENLVEAEIAKNRFMGLRRLEDEDLAGRNLFNLSEEDFLAMRPAVERLARRLKDRLSLRLRWGDTGRLDIKSTLRKNVGYGGPLPDLQFRKKKPARPQVLALCDVSRSVRDFSRFMLLFLYTLKEVIPQIRSFIFVGDLTEVTQLFQQRDLNEAVSMAAAGHGLTYPYGTDYGHSFAQFSDRYLTAVNSRTTVIVLGDARNNKLDPKTESLAAIAERARKVLWLNPEPHTFWGLGDSEMTLYRAYCTKVLECGSLKQLSDAVEDNLIP